MNNCVWCKKLTNSHKIGRHLRTDYFLCHICYTTLKPETINLMEDYIKKKNFEETYNLLMKMRGN